MDHKLVYDPKVALTLTICYTIYMSLLDEIRTSDKKPKNLLIYLAGKVKADPKLLKEFSTTLRNSSAVEKGICMEVMEYASKDNPELAAPYIDDIISYLDFDAPRVKWEAARVIANIAQQHPDKATKATNKLLINSNDKGTVVRWSAAFALGEIAKSTNDKKLIATIEQLAHKEQNNGVKNVYLKLLKQISNL